MDSFNLTSLKRRTTDLLSSLHDSLPQSLPSLNKPHHQTLRGTWQRIPLPALPRSSHSLDVVAGTAYIFGGEAASPREPVDNSVHAVTLPSGGAGADYYSIPARADNTKKGLKLERREDNAEQGLEEVPLSPVQTRGGEGEEKKKEEAVLGDVPAARVGHATAVIGSRIFLFGGRGGKDFGEVVEEKGRVWVFDTKTHLWGFLDPVTVEGVEEGKAWPKGRSYHSAVGVNKPDTFGERKDKGKHPGGTTGGGIKPLSRAESWREWVIGDTEETGIPQRPVVGRIAAEATDEDEEGFGTFIIHGGCLADGSRESDTWAFDVRSRVWQELPSAPGKPRGGTALCVSKSRLYRFGGFNGEGEEGGQLDVLDLVVDTFDDQVTCGSEVTLTARGAWRSLVQFSGEEYTAEEEAKAPLAERTSPADSWPGPRSVASLEALNVGGGREYLVLMLGERDPSGAGHAAAGKFWDDVWVFQVPPQGMSAASLHDAVLQVVGKKTGEGKWTKVETRPWDDEDDASAGGPGPRGWVATAPMGELEENGIVLWGGLNGENKRLGDGWIFRLE
ncbi:Nitrile-specifier protein 2 [Coniochaeta hoffmannii]|uniref:Nitrile-specifier protein 2 n=1 Tax=Coniochaeta hoffmannii TaxID=91930 RepID=A0AA38SDX4_9PEZI|nr:Nitrile-specifier protein 2 [Coniochaeta hoffmannii]